MPSLRVVLALLCLLATATPAGAEPYWLDAKATEPKGRRWYLLRFPTVTVDPGETEDVRLSLASCPGGVDSVFGVFVKPVAPSTEWAYARSDWGYPVDYNGYASSVFVLIENRSAAPMVFKLKLSVRCDE